MDLVLHICCAPDEAWVVHTLQQTYNLHCFFCNPNISPINEYELRLNEAKKVAQIYNVPFYSDQYEPSWWEQAISPFSDTPEGGERCRRCFLVRLQRTAIFCQQNGFKDFTTVMSISPHKSIHMLNEAGNLAAQEFNCTYLPFDFKKKNGFLQSVALSKELGLYRQDYCGCYLSKSERESRKIKNSYLKPVHNSSSKETRTESSSQINLKDLSESNINQL